jgi:sortase A
MSKKASKIFIVVLFLAGLSLLLYPFVANQWNNYRQGQLISNYEQTVADIEAQGTIDYEAEWGRAESYNDALLPSILPDSFAVASASEEDEGYMSCLNIGGDGIMGTIQIPKIKITLPIFHTTDEEVLEKAAGHLEGSSLPAGGKDTHAVISAHRGLPSAALFTDLDKLEEGDHFLLHILDDTLCYEVDQISVVEPEETQALSVEKGMDLVTLLTCTPYGVNSHRLLVRGHRVPYEPELVMDESIPLGNMSLHTNYLLWVAVGLAVTGAFCFVLYRRDKKMRVRQKSKAGSQGAPAGSDESGAAEKPQEDAQVDESREE